VAAVVVQEHREYLTAAVVVQVDSEQVRHYR
jgi:hypothetical protein